MNTLTEQLAEILNVPLEEVSANRELNSFADWDSLSILSVTALVDSYYGFQIGSKELAGVKTVDELKTLIGSRKTKN